MKWSGPIHPIVSRYLVWVELLGFAKFEKKQMSISRFIRVMVACKRHWHSDSRDMAIQNVEKLLWGYQKNRPFCHLALMDILWFAKFEEDDYFAFYEANYFV